MSADPQRHLQDRSPAVGASSTAAIEKPGYVVPAASEVVAAVESLYADRLRPFGRILLKRLRERGATPGAAAAELAPLVDPKGLRQVCEACDRLDVQQEDCKEYSTLLAGRAQDFVDVGSPVDCYPPAMWQQLAAYLESSPAEEVVLPGGRYACAQVLVGCRLPFFAGRPLGEVCHVVQLALSQKRLLGYMSGNIVPMCRSIESARRRCAAMQRALPCVGKAGCGLRLATLEEVRGGLQDILSSARAAGPPGTVALSHVKRLFRARLGLELSETALGCGRMCELLQDPRFGDLCHVEKRGRVQFVVQRDSCTAVAADPHITGAPEAHGSRADARSRPAAPSCPTSPAGRSEAVDLQKPRGEDGCGEAPAPLAAPPAPLSAGAMALTGHVQRLLALSLRERRQALRALSKRYGAAAAATKDEARCSMSRCSSGSSTGEGSARTSEEEGVRACWSEGQRSGPGLGAGPAKPRPPPGLAPPRGRSALLASAG